MKRLGILLPAAVFLCVLALAPRVALAEDGGSSGSDTAKTDNQAASDGQKQADGQTKSLETQRKEAAQRRLDDLKKEAEAEQAALKKQSEAVQKQQQKVKEAREAAFETSCKARVAGFKTRMQAVATGIQQRSETLDAILQRVQDYVKAHNLTVANYQALLTDIQAKKAVAQNIYATAKQDGTSFDCSTSDNAKESLASFKDVAEQEAQALKAYKEAVRAFITAVKTAAHAAEGTTNGNAQ